VSASLGKKEAKEKTACFFTWVRGKKGGQTGPWLLMNEGASEQEKGLERALTKSATSKKS